jgi:hypothetical protein
MIFAKLQDAGAALDFYAGVASTAEYRHLYDAIRVNIECILNPLPLELAHKSGNIMPPAFAMHMRSYDSDDLYTDSRKRIQEAYEEAQILKRPRQYL